MGKRLALRLVIAIRLMVMKSIEVLQNMGVGEGRTHKNLILTSLLVLGLELIELSLG